MPGSCAAYPPCQFLRKFTFEGAAVSRDTVSGDFHRPSPPAICRTHSSQEKSLWRSPAGFHWRSARFHSKIIVSTTPNLKEAHVYEIKADQSNHFLTPYLSQKSFWWHQIHPDTQDPDRGKLAGIPRLPHRGPPAGGLWRRLHTYPPRTAGTRMSRRTRLTKKHIPQKSPGNSQGFSAVNTCIPDTCPRSWSCCHGSSYRAPASSIHPRTASHPLCAARYGQPLLLSRTVPAPCTSHTANAVSEKVSLPSATCCHTHARKRPHGPPCAAPHVPHRNHRPSVPDIPDAYTASSAFSAWSPPPHSPVIFIRYSVLLMLRQAPEPRPCFLQGLLLFLLRLMKPAGAPLAHPAA